MEMIIDKKEYFDILDENGNPTGQLVARKEAHAKGILHGASHTFICRKRNGKTELLLQRRSHNKDSYPDCLDISSAGHMEAGMNFLETAVKELREELGINVNPAELTEAFRYRCSSISQQHGSVFNNQEINAVYLLWMDPELSSLQLQEEEVSEVVWMSIDEIVQRLEKDDSELCLDPAEFEELLNALERTEAENK